MGSGHHLLHGSFLGMRDGREEGTRGRRGSREEGPPQCPGQPSAEGDLRTRAAKRKRSG